MTSARVHVVSYPYLALCLSITMHKSQVQTMNKAVIDLGKSEATAGLTLFVCLSRANRPGDLLIEPMPFERLSKLDEKYTFHLSKATRESAP